MLLFSTLGKKPYCLYLFWLLPLEWQTKSVANSSKKNVKRLRPCNQIELQENINVLVPCGSGYSFTSSHATNHFAIATLVSFTLFNASRVALVLLFSWAATIALGQVYVGVHYPLDITIGALIGILVGHFCVYLFKIFYRILSTSKKIV